MTIAQLLTSGGGVFLVLVTLIQIAPIKLNPWTAIARAIGRAINKDVLSKLDETRKTLDEHIYEKYCDTHPDYENNRATHAVAHIKRVYDERLIKHDFL